MVRKCPDNIRAAKINANPNTGIAKQSAVIVGHVNRIPHKILVHLPAHVFKQQKMQLMDMEGVQLARAVFNDPVFDRSLLGPRDSGV